MMLAGMSFYNFQYVFKYTRSNTNMLEKFIRILFLFTAVFYLPSCSVLPNNTASPKVTIVKDNNNYTSKYEVGGKTVEYGENNLTSATILPFEKNIKGIKTQIMAFRAAYQKRAQSLLLESDISNNIQLIGVLAAVAGAADGNTSLQNGGAATAGLSGLHRTHFKLAIQTSNYQTATDAMDCAFRKLDAIPDAVFDALYENGTLHSAISDDLQNNNIEGANEILSNLFNSLNDTVYKIDKTLKQKQSEVIFVAPKVSDIQNAINLAIKDADIAKKIAAPASDEGAKFFSTAKAQSIPDDILKTLDKLTKLPSEVNNCAAIFGT
jgi:hypothetical protein